MLRKWINLVLPLSLFFCIDPISALAAEKVERIWEDEMVYYLVVDRFFNGEKNNDFNVNTKNASAYHGGDFQGIIEKLDYIRKMGFTTVCLDVIFDQSKYSQSGLYITDFYKPEEHYGTLDDFKQLIKEVHNRNMKVMIRFPLSFLSPSHPWIHDSNKQDWFDYEPVSENMGHGTVKLPKVVLNHDETAQYVLDVAKWWKEKTKLDGYFFYDIDQVPAKFWNRMIQELKTRDRNFYIVGELSKYNQDLLNTYIKFGFDSVLSQSTVSELQDAFEKPNQTLSNFSRKFEQGYSHKMLKMIDGQNISRFTDRLVDANQFPGDRWEPALTYLFTTPGVPMVYYGSEIALTGEDTMLDFRADPDLIEFIEKIGRVRNNYHSLTRGKYHLLYDRKGITVYTRTYKKETTIIVLNNTDKHQKMTIDSTELGSDKQLIGLLTGDLIKEQNGKYLLPIQKEKSEIYVVRQDRGLNIMNVVVIAAIPLFFIILFYFIRKRGKKA